MPWDTLTAAAGLGLLGAGHCLGMCGGIAAALAFAIPDASPAARVRLLLAYNIGRIASYALAGALAAAVVALGSGGHGGWPWARTLAGGLLIAMGFYLGDWWRGLVYLEQAGGILWRVVRPVGQRLMPVRNLPQALALGLVWGWLPCGLIYTALAYAATQADAARGALVMAVFGAGTLPAVLVGGLAAQRLQALLRRRGVRRGFALIYIVLGVWTLWSAWSHGGHVAPGSEHHGPADTLHQHH